jgi:signal transduction histidine kinase
MPERELSTVDVETLRTLFLFESLDDDKLAWISKTGYAEKYVADDMIYREGDAGTCFFVLLDGTISMTRSVRGGGDVEVNRTAHRGTFAGEVRALLGGDDSPRYVNSLRAVTDCTMLLLPSAEFSAKIRDWFPMGMHLVSAVFTTMRNSNTLVAERERLVALGSLTAGLTHELNNPAAAVVRATDALSDRLSHMRNKLAALSAGKLRGEQLQALVGIQDVAVGRMKNVPKRSPLEVNDAEDEMADWLDDHRIPRSGELAAVLVAGGLDLEWADEVAEAVGEGNLPSAMAWLGYTVETETLLREIEEASNRISGLLASARQYSQMDRAPQQRVDVHELLDATVAMLGHKIGDGVKVVTNYDRSLPPLEVYAAELNQVWTNLIDNAVDAMDRKGTLTISTSRADESALIEIADTGAGIPADIKDRIFEPFFSTKEVGHGTGLGLDISYRIVVKKHKGDIRVESEPGNTRFQIRLPFVRPTQEVPQEPAVVETA